MNLVARPAIQSSMGYAPFVNASTHSCERPSAGLVPVRTARYSRSLIRLVGGMNPVRQ